MFWLWHVSFKEGREKKCQQFYNCYEFLEAIFGSLGKDFNVFRGKDIMMCRKCFSAYERYGSLQKSISENLMHAMDVIELEATSADKRPRMNTPVPSQASTSSSPDVAVSFFTF